MKNTYVLAFDCSTSRASVALNSARRDIAHGQQAGLLVLEIQQLMKEAGIGYAELDCIVSTVGPGSFTGLRIALATLHGLALATGKPVKVITSSEAVAWAAEAPHFIVALNAGKGEVFIQEFTKKDGVPMAVDSISLHPQAIIGQLKLPTYSNVLPETDPNYVAGPDAAVLARIAPQLKETELSQAVPYYIREADAKIPQKLAWL